MRRIITLLTLIYITTFMFSVIEANTVTLSTLEWEPYIGKNLESQGYVYEIIREAFKRSGYEVKIEYYPWMRAVKMSDDGLVDGYFPEYYAESRKDYAYFSEPFQGGPVGFFKLKSNPAKWSTLDDLKPYSIGVVRDYVNEEKFDNSDFLRKEEANDDETNFRKLIGRRVDLIVADKYVGEYLLRTKFAKDASSVEFMSPELVEHNLYLCISRKTENAQEKINAFNKGLQAIKNDGTYNSILTKHNISTK